MEHKETKGFDLAAFDTATAANEGITVELVNPATRAPLGVKIKVHGIDSEAYRKIARAQQNRRLKMIAKARGQVISTAEEQEAEGLDMLVKCTISWEGMVLGGEKLEFTPENVRMVYTKYSWVKEQVDEAMADRSLCLKN